jgi:hypothetical protein
MKILLGFILALFISSNASAGDLDMEQLDGKSFNTSEDKSYGRIQTTCIDGYKFLFLTKQISQFNGGTSGINNPKYTYSTSIQNQVVQFYIEKDGRAVPAKC